MSVGMLWSKNIHKERAKYRYTDFFVETVSGLRGVTNFKTVSGLRGVTNFKTIISTCCTVRISDVTRRMYFTV
jgi:hypothetical protein